MKRAASARASPFERSRLAGALQPLGGLTAPNNQKQISHNATQRNDRTRARRTHAARSELAACGSDVEVEAEAEVEDLCAQELFTTIYIGFLILITTSFLMFLAERPTENVSSHSNGGGNSNASSGASAPSNRSEHPEMYDRRIKNFADALWWGVVRTLLLHFTAMYCSRTLFSIPLPPTGPSHSDPQA